MKQNVIMKVAVASALLFAVNLNANAQFGNVLKKAMSCTVFICLKQTAPVP